MIIGITGSIGSGKTTVAEIFGTHGFHIIDADKIGHKLLAKGTAQYSQLVAYFGKSILDMHENINRITLGKIAFSKNNRYRELNKIMLPPIVNVIKSQAKRFKASGAHAVIDAPLLLETKAKQFVDKVVVVKASHENIFRRSNKFSKRQIIKIMHYQMPIASKLKRADFVINNDGSIRSLDSQVQNIINALNNKI